MSRHRFFLDTALPDESGPIDLPLTGADLHHAVSVLRLKGGEELEVVDPAGSIRRARVVSASTDRIVAEIVDKLEQSEQPLVTLVQGVAKGERMDWIVRQAVEIGAARVIPVITSRTVVRLDAKKRVSRGERWRRVARAAAEQSHQDRVPMVADPAPLRAALENVAEEDLVVVLWEEARELGLGEALAPWRGKRSSRITVVVGPEGGFSESEVRMIEEAGAVTVSLGSSILRTETAAVASLAIVLHALGYLGGPGE